MGTGEDRQDAFTEAQKEEKENSCEELYSGQTQLVEPEVPDGYEACKALFLDFIDGKKTFYFNGTEDFSTLEELFHAAVEKETDWKEQLKIAGLSMVCEELSASIGDTLTLEKKELPELGGQKEFYGMAAEEDGLYSYNLQNHMDEGNPIAFRLDSAYGDVFSMQDQQKLVMGSDELLSRTRFHEYNLAEVDIQKQGKELMKALGLDQTELWEVQDETVFWWNYLDETCQQSEAEPAKQFTYCRMVDGVPVIRLFDQPYCEIQEDGLMKWPEEEIRAVYGKDGLLSFSYSRLKEILRFCYAFECGIALVLAVLLSTLAPGLMGLFMQDASIVAIGVPMLRMQLLGMVFIAIILVTTCTFQSEGKAGGAFLLSVSRQGVVFAVVIMLASSVFGYRGVLMAQAISDFLTAILAVCLFYKLVHKEDLLTSTSYN